MCIFVSPEVVLANALIGHHKGISNTDKNAARNSREKYPRSMGVTYHNIAEYCARLKELLAEKYEEELTGVIGDEGQDDELVIIALDRNELHYALRTYSDQFIELHGMIFQRHENLNLTFFNDRYPASIQKLLQQAGSDFGNARPTISSR